MSDAASGRAGGDREDADAITVEFHLTPEEWVETAIEHNRNSELYQKAIANRRTVFAVLVAVIGILGLLSGQTFFTMAWLFAGATATVLLPKIFEGSIRKQYQTFAEDGIANGMFGAHRVSLTPEGILDETAAYSRLTRWHAIDRVIDGPGAFLVYLGRNAFLPIPHSAFRDSETLRRFADRFFGRMGTPGPALSTDGVATGQVAAGGADPVAHDGADVPPAPEGAEVSPSSPPSSSPPGPPRTD